MAKITNKINWVTIMLEILVGMILIAVPLFAPKNYLFPYTSMKSILFMGIVGVGVILFSIDQFYREVRVSWLHAVLFIYSAALALSAIAGVDAHSSWFGTLQNGTGILYIYGFILYALIIGSLIKRDKNFIWKLVAAAYIGAFFVSLTTFFGRAAGTLGNTSYTGPYLLFGIAAGLGLIVSSKGRVKKTFLILGTLPMVFSPVFISAALWHTSFWKSIQNPMSIAGEAQAASIGLILLMTVCAGLFYTRSSSRVKQWLGAVMLLITVVTIGFVTKQIVTENTKLHAYIVQEKTDNRFVFWDIAKAGLTERPATGYGWGNYGLIFQKYFDPSMFNIAAEPATMYAHNSILEYAATTGIVGLTTFILLLLTTIIVLYQSVNNENRIVRVVSTVFIAAIVGYVWQSMFIFDTPVTYLMFFSVVGIALGFYGKGGFVIKKRFVSLSVSAGGVLTGLYCVLWLSILPWKESIVWVDRLTGKPTMQSPQSISPVGTDDDVAYISGRFVSHITTETITASNKDTYIAILERLKTDLDHPQHNGFESYKQFLVKGIIENNLYALQPKHAELLQEAQGDLRQAIKINPNSPENYFNLAQSSVYANKMPESYIYLRAGIALAPDYIQGYRIGRALLRIAPNPTFESYLSSMEKRWGIHE